MWRALKPPVLSGQIMALQGLELLVYQARESGSLAEILSADAVSYIAQSALSADTSRPSFRRRKVARCDGGDINRLKTEVDGDFDVPMRPGAIAMEGGTSDRPTNMSPID